VSFKLYAFPRPPLAALFRSAREATGEDGEDGEEATTERSEREAAENAKRWQSRRRREEAGDERVEEKNREKEREKARVRETTKSVNFLTFYEPSEFHNLEPVRVVLCTRKVSTRPVLPRAPSPPSSSPSLSCGKERGEPGRERERERQRERKRRKEEDPASCSGSLPGNAKTTLASLALVSSDSPIRFAYIRRTGEIGRGRPGS